MSEGKCKGVKVHFSTQFCALCLMHAWSQQRRETMKIHNLRNVLNHSSLISSHRPCHFFQVHTMHTRVNQSRIQLDACISLNGRKYAGNNSSPF